MALPTNAEIDAAVPADGEPSRALTNTALKDIVGAASYLPVDGSVPTRSVANENFSGGRLKANPATDPDDCVNLAQLGAMLPSFMNRQVMAPPSAPDAPGNKGEYAITEEGIYFCVATNTWRMIQLLAWS